MWSGWTKYFQYWYMIQDAMRWAECAKGCWIWPECPTCLRGFARMVGCDTRHTKIVTFQPRPNSFKYSDMGDSLRKASPKFIGQNGFITKLRPGRPRPTFPKEEDQKIYDLLTPLDPDLIYDEQVASAFLEHVGNPIPRSVVLFQANSNSTDVTRQTRGP